MDIQFLVYKTFCADRHLKPQDVKSLKLFMKITNK